MIFTCCHCQSLAAYFSSLCYIHCLVTATWALLALLWKGLMPLKSLTKALREWGSKQCGLNVSFRATELVEGLEHKSYKSGWGSWGWLVWKKESQEGPHCPLQSPERKSVAKWGQPLLPCLKWKDVWWHNNLLLCQQRFKLDVRGKKITERAFRHWNKLSRDVVQSLTLEVFERYLDVALGDMVWGWLGCLVVGLEDPKDFFQPWWFCIQSYRECSV